MPDHPLRVFARPLLIAAIGLALAACGGGKEEQARVNGVADEALPAPQGRPGSGVTGMPAKPGPGQIGLPAEVQPAPVMLDENGNPILPDGLPAEGVPGDDATAALIDGTTPPGVETEATEPTPQDAVAVVRDYYAAINGRNFDQAYALWSDGGRASGQTPQQFADGFADTGGVSVEILAPSRVDAAAGSRFIEVPVTLTATQRDGNQRRYVGAYTLRRAVVDGASAEQRAWRIASADLREVAQ